MRRLVNFVRRSCTNSLKPAKSRYNCGLEMLKQRLKQFLRRDLTAREEHLLELSAPLLGSDRIELTEREQDFLEDERDAA